MKTWTKLIAVALPAGAVIFGVVRAVRHHRAAMLASEPGSSLDNPIQTQADAPPGQEELESLGDPVLVTEEVIVIADVPGGGR